jgi:hypothetical protein
MIRRPFKAPMSDEAALPPDDDGVDASMIRSIGSVESRSIQNINRR